MQLFQVQSSNVEAVGYDPLSSTLRVQFKNGSIYDYEAVPQQKFVGLLAAESTGKFLNAEIKPHHRFVKIDPLREAALTNTVLSA